MSAIGWREGGRGKQDSGGGKCTLAKGWVLDYYMIETHSLTAL